MFFGLKFFYVNTLGYDWPLFLPKKSPQAEPAAGLPDVRSDADCRRLIASLRMPLYRACFTVMLCIRLCAFPRRSRSPSPRSTPRQMVLHVIGKRNKERILPLTEPILQMLREVSVIPPQPTVALSSRRPATHLSADATARAAILSWRDACGFQLGFRTALATSQLCCRRCSSGASMSDHRPDLARTPESAIHRDLHPPHRAVADQLRHLLCQTTDGLFREEEVLFSHG